MNTPHADGWAAGDAYEHYMGRWSRPLARVFLDWLRPSPLSHWLEVGCGTGAFTSALCERCDPAFVVACDPSAAFIEHARRELPDARVTFVVGGAAELPRREGGYDAVASALVLNFLPDAPASVAAMRDRLRPGGVLAAAVWDYADGMEFLRIFWEEAVAGDASAARFDEGRRFPICTAAGLTSLFAGAGLTAVQGDELRIQTEFANFDDYWAPFLRATGPAPSYVAALEPAERDALRERLRQRLPASADGGIRLNARAWAVRGTRG